MTTYDKLRGTRCFKLVPQVHRPCALSCTYLSHRCKKCLTKVWCSKECLLLNKEKHKEFCQEGAEERKVKDDDKIRKESGMEELEQSFAKMSKVTPAGLVQGFEDVKESCQKKGNQDKSKVTKKR